MQTHAQLSMESFPNFTEGNKSTLLCEMGWPFSAADDFLCTITIKGFQAGIWIIPTRYANDGGQGHLPTGWACC